MNILENLLKKFIDVPNNLYELTNKHIIEVDEYLKLIDANKLVIGYVETCVEHPNSDHLHVTTVNVGHEVLQIVCGASNIKAGQTVIVATNGTILPGPFEIKKSTIRGVESNGMICSLKELGFDEIKIGRKQRKVYEFKNAQIFFDVWDKETYPYPYIEIEVQEESKLNEVLELLGIEKDKISLKSIVELQDELKNK
jgi:tRNA-binding EMAP/Myf-like protein